MKNLKDYLHLYLGCEFVVEKSSYHWVHELSVHVGDVKKLTAELLYNYHVGAGIIIKPILRPLPDMAEKEIEHLLWLINDSQIHLDKDSRISKEEVEGCIDDITPDDNAIVVEFTLRCFVGKLYISEHSGNLRLFDEDDKEHPIEWNPDIFQYLLSKHFDLFNLIPEGLAINPDYAYKFLK